MLSIQEFSSLTCAVFLMLILGFVIKIKRGLMNRDARMPENLGQPVEPTRRSAVRNEENYKYNYSVPCKAISFFCLLSNVFSDFGSVGRKRKKTGNKKKLEKESGTRRPGISA